VPFVDEHTRGLTTLSGTFVPVSTPTDRTGAYLRVHGRLSPLADAVTCISVGSFLRPHASALPGFLRAPLLPTSLHALTFLDSQTKPFACPTCNKAFARVYVSSFVEFITHSVAKLYPSDALKRHQISHDPTVAKRQKIDHLPRPRTGQACRACAAAKLKCEDEKPCARCRQKESTVSTLA
jgi:hypothetical protein